jgi:hypothetical protein
MYRKNVNYAPGRNRKSFILSTRKIFVAKNKCQPKAINLPRADCEMVKKYQLHLNTEKGEEEEEDSYYYIHLF